MSHPFRRAVEPDEVPVLFAGAELADAPPFGPQYIPAQQRILGARHVYRGPILSLVGDFGPLSYGRWIPCDDQGRFKDRPDQGFHAINLAGLSDTLADAQLVGYRKGAFTGALKNTPGALDQCAAGRNLFIDEVGAASLAIQNKLLRIVEEKKFTPLGSIEPVLLLGRLIFAAQRSQLVGANVSRDLRYRMCRNMIDVPSLRARLDGHPDELAFFVRRFAEKASGPQAARTAAESLALIHAKYPNHRWAGNMRELIAWVENVATHRDFVPPNSVAVTSVAPGTPRRAATLPPEPMPVNDRTVVSAGEALAQAVQEGSLGLKEAERQYILHVLELAGGNLKAAARRLGIGWRKVRDTVENNAAAAAGDDSAAEERGQSRASARAGR